MWNLIGRDVIPDDECGVPIANPVHRKNVWLGTSVENQEQADRRIPELLKCRDLAPVLLLSVEPLLGPVDLAVPWEGEPEHPTLQVDGVIVGGESGRGARVCHVDWIRAVLSQCQAADVPCFVKQLGPAVQANYGDMDIAHPMMGWKHLRWVGEEQVCRPHDPKGGDWTEWPEDLRVRQLPEVSVEANR